MNITLKSFTLSAFLLFALFACEQTTNNQAKKTTADIHSIDSSNYTILKFDNADTWLSKNIKPTSLTKSEIEEIEIILKQCIDKYNPDQKLRFDTISKKHPEYNLKIEYFVIDLSKYKRQYVPFINSAGQKEVWVNCFCYEFPDWRNEILEVNDGGNCFFNLTINLTTKTFSEFIVNGEA